MLIFHNPRNFRHTSEVLLRKALAEMGHKVGAYTAVVSDDISWFTPEKLKEFDAVFFNLAHGVKGVGQLGPEGQQALLDYVKDGGGFIAIHSAIDAFGGNKEYREMLGGTFSQHPFGGKKLMLKNEKPESPFTAAFGKDSFPFIDEVFTIKGPYSRDRQTVLLSIDWEKSPEAQAIDKQAREEKKGLYCFRDDNDYAVSWIKPCGQGRVFYTSLGHRNDTIGDPRHLKHLLAAIQYACGDIPAPTTTGHENHERHEH